MYSKYPEGEVTLGVMEDRMRKKYVNVQEGKEIQQSDRKKRLMWMKSIKT